MSKEKLNEIYKLVKETGYVQSINMYREMDNDSTKEYNLILSLSTCPFYEGDTRIKLVFYNIQDFKLGDINNFYKVLFEITNVADRQLEDIMLMKLNTIWFLFGVQTLNIKVSSL